MKNKLISTSFATLFLALFMTPVSSWALFEARLTYGSLASQQSVSDICQGSCTVPSNAPSIVPTFGLGADAIVSLPLFPIGFGLRYEDMKLSTSSSTVEADLKYTRTALLLNYRFIDTIIHFGPIASIGLSHSGNLNIKENGVTRVDATPGSVSSYSLGLELGAKPLVVVPIKVGAEAGYMMYDWGTVTNSVDGSQKDINLSGYYLKLFLGIDI